MACNVLVASDRTRLLSLSLFPNRYTLCSMIGESTFNLGPHPIRRMLRVDDLPIGTSDCSTRALRPIAAGPRQLPSMRARSYIDHTISGSRIVVFTMVRRVFPIGTRTTEGIKYVIVIKVRRWEYWGYAIALAIKRKGEHSQEIGPHHLPR
jgi:hypothetical protein